MKKSGFADEQIIGFLKQAEGGMNSSEARRLKALEGENTKLKKLLAEAMLDIEALKVVAWGKR